MNKNMSMLLAAPFIIGLTVLLVMWKAKRTRAQLERYIEEHNLDAKIDKVGIPPLRFWLRNRKGDGRARLRSPDGTVYWTRVRRKLFGGDPVVFFT